MGFSGKKWELVGDRGIYRDYGRYTLSCGLYILECEMTHTHFGPHMDVNDPGVFKEAASRVNVTMKDQQAQTTFIIPPFSKQ